MKIELTNVLFFPITFGTRKELIKLMMRTFIFLFCSTLFSLAPKHACSQNDKIVIDADTIMSVDEVFNIVKKQTDYMFVYHFDLFKDFPKVHLKKGVIRLNKLLDHTLDGSPVNIIFAKNNSILIKEKAPHSKALQHRVSGTVTDPLGNPLPGATVLIKGTTLGVTTDFDGRYSIFVPNPENVLIFSFLGFEKQEITVGNQTTIDVSLKESISTLDEVTINAGYYITSERERTGNISKIEAKDMEKQPVNNPLAAMQGHLPGVVITQNSGVPGGSYRVRIRGDNFISNSGAFFANPDNEPLYIVDGVPYGSEFSGLFNTESPIPGGRVSPLNTINPANIESIEVLKDADATAIYGSRGANGVVLITTKKGKMGKTQIKVNVSSTLSRVTRFLDLMNTEQYLEMRKEAITNDGLTLEDLPEYISRTMPDLLVWDQDRYTDWQEVLIGGTAYRHNAQLSFSGGNAQTQFLLSGGYSSETTVFPGDSKYDKATVLLNLNHQSEDERLKLNVSANYGADTNNLPGSDFTRQSRTLAPNAPALYDDQGNLNWENSTWQNPLAILERSYNALTHGLIANTVLSYHPTPAWEFKTSLGFTDYRTKTYFETPHTSLDPNTTSGQSSINGSSISINDQVQKSWSVEPQINWQKNWKDTSLKLLVGATFQQTKDQQLSQYGLGFTSNSQLRNLKAANRIQILQDIGSEYKYQAFFGRINFNWQDTYILNLTGRRDGSSRFGPGKRFGYFGAMGAAWIFTKEPFLKQNQVLSFGKLRASYGITGSDNVVDNYGFYDSYEDSGNYNGPGLAPSGLYNPNLYSWGTNKKLEAAVELGFFKDRLFVSTAWYQNRSSDQLINIPLPATTGFPGIDGNLNDAIVENKGIEIDLRTLNIQSDAFKWSTTFNISANRNKLVAFPGLEGSTFAESFVIGQPLGVRKIYHAIGVDPETGVYQFEDFNNDGTIRFSDDAKLFLNPNPTPKYVGGLGNTIQYKNLQLDVFFQFTKQEGFKELSFFGDPGSTLQNMPVSLWDRWQQPGDESPIQRYYLSNSALATAANRYKSSDVAVTDTSFIRLRNVSLSYTVPKTATKSMDVSVYLHGQNLFVITGYDGVDPEVSALDNLAPLRQFTLGLNLGF
ncbi:SusC/RagA family TonB-linked outer membrane protein [Mariniflexile rhizosphaerae]|uniref:SusC/RagA family TonB-linked outer membrane protein n=1 Tax=unclassified Mariniflexile TaxID=2643887 RepID=UPI001F02AFCD|nr:SusC/RagA family TonB-linked outer membrane protein [Mariniflexile sp. TRM1-10]